MMHVRGRLLEYSDTVKIFKPHLFRSSNSCRGKCRKTPVRICKFETSSSKAFSQLENLTAHLRFYLRQQVFLVSFDAKAGDAAVEAGPMRHLLHTANLSHQLLLLLLLPSFRCGRRDLHLVLFVCRKQSEQTF